MSRRTKILALAGSAALALLLLLVCQPGSAPFAAAGMSAPPVRTASIESAGAVRLLPSRFDWHAAPSRTPSLTPVSVVAIAAAAFSRHNGPDSPSYGPLHRRPPPRLS